MQLVPILVTYTAQARCGKSIIYAQTVMNNDVHTLHTLY